jgi:hypothetical protein
MHGAADPGDAGVLVREGAAGDPSGKALLLMRGRRHRPTTATKAGVLHAVSVTVVRQPLRLSCGRWACKLLRHVRAGVQGRRRG